MVLVLSKVNGIPNVTTMTTLPSTFPVKSLFLLIIGCLALTISASWFGTTFTMDGVSEWYTSIHKPLFHPPHVLFAPAWFIVYTCMAISLFYLLKEHHANKHIAITLFVVQLPLNAAWSILFFKLHYIGMALAVTVVLLFVLIAYFITVKSIRSRSAYLFLPYIACIIFTVILFTNIWRLN
jgi:translocator protein